MIQILRADARKIPLADASVDCVVTSPPYWNLRNYGVAGQIGLEKHHDCLGWARGENCGTCHVCVMRQCSAEVHRVLKPGGTYWLQYGDCYATRGKNRTKEQATARTGLNGSLDNQCACLQQQSKVAPGLKRKDLVGMAWRIALALQADGWWLRNDIVWNKPAVQPESCADRATKSHEYLFLLTKSERYYFNQEAWLEPASENTHARLAQNIAAQAGSRRANGGTRADRPLKTVMRKPFGWDQGEGMHDVREYQQPGVHPKALKERGREELGLKTSSSLGHGPGWRTKQNASFCGAVTQQVPDRNRRTVWTIPAQPSSEEHFAVFPEALVEPCLLAGCPPGGTVADFFGGTGTVMVVANRLGFNGVMAELSPQYIEMARRRIFADVTPSRVEAKNGQRLLLAQEAH